MSANTYTTSDLVSAIKLVSHYPEGSATYSASNLLTLANRELQTRLMKDMLSTRGGYFLTYRDYAAASDGLYVIPGDAIAGALANVELVVEPTIIPVSQIEESEQFSTISPVSTTYGFFMKGNYVQILPTPSIGVARLWYFKRPSKLIQTSEAAQVVSVAGAVITVTSVPSTLVTGDAIDVCGDQPPFNIIGQSEITNITGVDITLADTITGISAGDWIALRDQTPIPQIPVEYRVILEQMVIVKMYESQGYLDKMKAAKAQLEELRETAKSLITPRVQSQTKIINASNGGFAVGNWNRLSNFPAARNV